MSIFSYMATTATMAIPESEISKLDRIANMPDGDFSSLLAALKITAPSINLRNYSANLVKASPQLKDDDVLPVIAVFFALNRSKENSGLDSEKVIALASNFLSETHSTRFPSQKLSLLQKRLKHLFDSGNAATLACKSMNVLTAHEHIFLNARIFSDIRPVFGNSTESIQAAVVVHNLKITYRQSSEDKEFFVALDSDDIETLKKIIARAESKTTAVASLLEKSKVTFLDVKEK